MSRAEEDGRGVERKEKRSRVKGEEKETLSYIGPISTVPVSGISLNKLPLSQFAAFPAIQMPLFQFAAYPMSNLPMSHTATLSTNSVNSLACKLT